MLRTNYGLVAANCNTGDHPFVVRDDGIKIC